MQAAAIGETAMRRVIEIRLSRMPHHSRRALSNPPESTAGESCPAGHQARCELIKGRPGMTVRTGK